MSNTLQSMLEKLMGEYAIELADARATETYKRPLGDVVRRDIASAIAANITDGVYKVKGSVGAGRWTDVPWIAVFDTRITSSATKGVYIVYLLNKDTKTLYLTLNQGATDVSQAGGSGTAKLLFTGIAGTNNTKTLDALIQRSQAIYQVIGEVNDALHGPIDSGSKPYDAGCIYYKEYHYGNVPDDDELFDDLHEFLDIYRQYYESFIDQKQKPGMVEQTKEPDKFMPVTVGDQLNQIETYITARGFQYPAGLIENFYLSLKSKPFVILAGTSGTGKTRLVKLFAEAIGADYYLVSVRPDWSDGSDLFGHYDLNGRFVRGPVCDAFDAAIKNPKRPVLLCLDEMNLARVEYYLSDFLSVIESRERQQDGSVRTAPIAQYAAGIPDNLYIIGTVNMDETTFPFSKKVLDRANTIEFSYVDLMPNYDVGIDATPLSLQNSFLRSEYLVLTKDCAVESEYVNEVCQELQLINEILLRANAHVGYRVRDEIVFYMLNNHMADGLLDDQDALDNEIMQKILPRIQGSSAAVRDMLCDLFKECASDSSQKTGDSDSERMDKVLHDAELPCKYRKSAKKIELMVRRFEEDGFTSYWL